MCELAALPAAWHRGVTNGDSIPSGISVHNFVNDDGVSFTKFIMRTGQSWGGSTAYDMVTTLERDDQF